MMQVICSSRSTRTTVQLNGLRVRMHDKTARINHLIDSGATPENESLRDSFIDLLNYSAIALMVLDGTWPRD
jgi:hypothetical protein